jgi:hypothetical protein
VQNFGLRVNGMRVAAVLPGTSAERLGFTPGDVVVRLNERTLPRGLDLLDYMSLFEPGARLVFVVARDNRPVELQGRYEPMRVPRVEPLFTHGRPSGRIDATRQGNRVVVTTRGVAEFTVLLSPDVFDLDRPITVVADGHAVFDGTVARSVETLMKWAARDNDRTMLYGAEVHVKLASAR